MERNSVFAVIMAGGGGTRFWPWSREKQPKQILPLLSNRSMIRETVERIRPLIPVERIFIVTARAQVAAVQKEIRQIRPENLLVEPVGRNTAPCVTLAAAHIRRKDPRGVMVVLPADHYIGNRKGYLKSLRAAVDFARQKDCLITLGVKPTEPETGYGYIERGEAIAKARGVEVYGVKSFREKPSRIKAKAYLRTGKYLWNSGMFIWRADVFWKAVKEFLPALHGEMKTLEKFIDPRREKGILERIYASCPSISVDYGVMEKAENVALIEAQFSWNDVGSWAAFWNLRSKDRDGNARVLDQTAGQGKILLQDTCNCLVRSEEKLIAVIGLKDTVVVEAGNAILVCPRDRSQDVRRVLEELKIRGWKEYL